MSGNRAQEQPLTAAQVLLCIRACMAECGGDGRVTVAADPRGLGKGAIMGVPIRRVGFSTEQKDVVIVPNIPLSPMAEAGERSALPALNHILADVRAQGRIAELETENQRLRERLGDPR